MWIANEILEEKGGFGSIGVFLWSTESYNSRYFLEGGSSTHKFVSSLMQSNTSKITNQLDKRLPISALVGTS